MENLAGRGRIPILRFHIDRGATTEHGMKDRLRILRQLLRGCMIAVLIGTVIMVVLSASGRPGPGHGATRTLNDINALAQAIEGFETEYGRLPNTPSMDFELEGPPAAELVTVLLGKEDTASNMQNPRQLAFLSMRISRNKRRGGLVLSPDNKAEGIYDAWGNPLRVILRPPGQSTLTVSHAGKQVTTSKPAVVISRGADGKWLTKDDLVSAIRKR
jgi:hypothetical protein